MNEIQKIRATNRMEKIAKYRAALRVREERDLNVITDYQKRIKVTTIAKKYGLSRTRVYQILDEYNVSTHAEEEEAQPINAEALAVVFSGMQRALSDDAQQEQKDGAQ